MNISMPDPMRDWVEAQAGTGRYDDAGDYVRDLIARDRARSAKIADMQKLVDEARTSGISEETIDDVWDRALEQAGQRP